jgi:hypothetical protein
MAPAVIDINDSVRNPNYGSGVFRRQVRLRCHAGEVHAGLEDMSHCLHIRLQHDGVRVTAIDSYIDRIPLSTCPGAAVPLRRFVGMHLEIERRALRTEIPPRANCTHLYDLAELALAHACRGGERRYDVEIPDEYPDPAWSRILCDGREVHRWQTKRGTIVLPETYAGRPLLRGFTRWASETFSGDALEAALVFSQGYLVSRARRWDVEASAGDPVTGHTSMLGMCHSYSAGVVAQAMRLANSTIDATDPGYPLLAGFPHWPSP